MTHISVHRRVQKWHVSSKRPNVSMTTEIINYTTCKNCCQRPILKSVLYTTGVYGNPTVTQIYTIHFKHFQKFLIWELLSLMLIRTKMYTLVLKKWNRVTCFVTTGLICILVMQTQNMKHQYLSTFILLLKCWFSLNMNDLKCNYEFVIQIEERE